MFSDLISALANLSFSQGIFPSTFKLALVSPSITKPDFDKEVPSNYRQIFNLIIYPSSEISYYSLEFNNTSYPHSTLTSSSSLIGDTTPRKRHCFLTLDNILHSIDQGWSTILVSLDLSAAFDTIDHLSLFSRLQSSFGIQGTLISGLIYIFPTAVSLSK